jgi:hypothetical protein
LEKKVWIFGLGISGVSPGHVYRSQETKEFSNCSLHLVHVQITSKGDDLLPADDFIFPKMKH